MEIKKKICLRSDYEEQKAIQAEIDKFIKYCKSWWKCHMNIHVIDVDAIWIDFSHRVDIDGRREIQGQYECKFCQKNPNLNYTGSVILITWIIRMEMGKNI